MTVLEFHLYIRALKGESGPLPVELTPRTPVEVKPCLCGCGIYPKCGLYALRHFAKFSQAERDAHFSENEEYLKARRRDYSKGAVELKAKITNPSERIRFLVAGRVRAMQKIQEQGARKSKLALYDLSLSDHLSKNPPVLCPCCGCVLDYSTGGGRSDCSPSIDRVDNTKGYIIGNTVVICWGCNRRKSDSTVHDLANIYAYCRAQETSQTPLPPSPLPPRLARAEDNALYSQDRRVRPISAQ